MKADKKQPVKDQVQEWFERWGMSLPQEAQEQLAKILG